MTDWLQVESSNIAAFRYDAETATLDVAFLNGGVYRYDGVPGPVVQGFANAESKGKYFHANIRTSFPYTKLDATWPGDCEVTHG